MDDVDWKILTIINEERNLTKAAERLYISQPALTYRIRSLEKEFGTKILNRYPNGVSFTAPGEYILRLFQEMLDRLKFTKEYVQNMELQVEGPLQLGISTVFAKFKLAPILKTYKQRFPNVQIILHTGSSTTYLPDLLENDQVDIAILRGDYSWPEKKHILFEEPLCIISSQPLTLDQLPSMPWIQYQKPVLTKTDASYRLWWQEKFNNQLPQITKVDSIEACLQLVSHGIGWTILPKIHIRNRRSFHTLPITWQNASPLLQKTIMMYRGNTLKNPAAKAFIDFILKECFIS